MDNEKIMILKMLEQGKITSSEAAKLLESIKDKTTTESTTERSTTDRPTTGSVPHSNSQASGAKVKSNPKKVLSPEWTSEFGKKAEVFAREMEPKLQRVAQVVAEKTSSFADKVSKTLATPPTPDERPKTVNTTATVPKRTTGNEKDFELKVTDTEINEISMKACNGYVYIKGYNGDKISGKVTYDPIIAGADIDVLKLGGTYYLNYDPEQFRSVNIEAYVPSTMMSRLLFETKNGKISVEGVTAEKLNVYSNNGEISIGAVKADSVTAETVNGKLVLSNITADTGSFETANGAVELAELDIKQMKIDTSNAPVTLLVTGFKRNTDYNWSIQTSNARLKANIPSSIDTAYKIKAHTSISEVSFGLSGLNYTANERNYIEAESPNYTMAAKNVNLELDTSNAVLSINS